MLGAGPATDFLLGHHDGARHGTRDGKRWIMHRTDSTAASRRPRDDDALRLERGIERRGFDCLCPGGGLHLHPQCPFRQLHDSLVGFRCWWGFVRYGDYTHVQQRAVNAYDHSVAMKLRDSTRITTWLDEDKPSDVPVERPSKNGYYDGKCVVREVPPPRYEPPVHTWTNRIQVQYKTCVKCQKEKPLRAYAYYQRARENTFCLMCSTKYPGEWRARVRAAMEAGQTAYRFRKNAPGKRAGRLK